MHRKRNVFDFITKAISFAIDNRQIISTDFFWPLFAKIIVPCISLSFWFIADDSFLIFDKKINTISVQTFHGLPDDATHPQRVGKLLVFEPTADKAYIPIKSLNNSFWLSLTNREFKENKSKISVDRESIEVEMPLYGPQRQFAVFFEGKADEAKIPGKSFKLKEKTLSSDKTKSLILWVFISCIFGLGFAFKDIEIKKEPTED